MTATITAQVDDHLREEIEKIAMRNFVDASTITRQLLAKAVRNEEIDSALRDYEKGKMTLWQAAESAKLSLWEMMGEAKLRNICVPYTIDDLKEDIKALKDNPDN
jgi:predicted HTH domain antitoxin